MRAVGPFDQIMTLAIPEAESLNHQWLGTPHILLAVANSDSDARRVLDELGMSHGEIRKALSAMLGDGLVDPEGSQLPRWMLNPSATRAAIWADGFAAARGDTPAETDWLVALLWDNSGMSVELFRALGVGRREVLHALRDEGLEVPPIDPLADLPTTDWGDPITIDASDLDAVLEELPRRLRLGDRDLAWNLTGDGRAVIVGARSLDLPSVVELILAARP